MRGDHQLCATFSEEALNRAFAALDQAERCRRLALTIGDQQTIDTLTLMAEEFDEKARMLGSRH